VKYLLVGGYAYAIYAEPRYTKDIDLFYEMDEENAEKLFSFIQDFGFSSLELDKNDFLVKGRVIQLGMPPYRVDLLNDIEGISFREAWENKTKASYGEQEIHVIGKMELIKNKTAVGREQDKLDVKRLKETDI
jgi:hypothetical protein